MNPNKRLQIEAHLSTLPNGHRFLLNQDTAKLCGVGVGTLHRTVTKLMVEGKVLRDAFGFKWNSSSTSSGNGIPVQVELHNNTKYYKPNSTSLIDNKEVISKVQLSSSTSNGIPVDPPVNPFAELEASFKVVPPNPVQSITPSGPIKQPFNPGIG